MEKRGKEGKKRKERVEMKTKDRSMKSRQREVMNKNK